MSLRDKIYKEFKRTKKEAKHVWMTNQYIGFYNDKLNPLEQREFLNELQRMCEEGLLTQEGDWFRLTEKCEIALWGE